MDFFFTQISLWLKIIIKLKLLTLDSITDSLTIKPPWKAIRNVCNSREAWVCRIYGSCRAPWCQCRLRPLPYSCSTYRSRVVRRARYIHWRTIFSQGWTNNDWVLYTRLFSLRVIFVYLKAVLLRLEFFQTKLHLDSLRQLNLSSLNFAFRQRGRKWQKKNPGPNIYFPLHSNLERLPVSCILRHL